MTFRALTRKHTLATVDGRIYYCRLPYGPKEHAMMPAVNVDQNAEAQALRRHGLLGRGTEMGNALYAIDISGLPHEANHTIALIASGGPFPFPAHDGHPFSNRFGDLPSGSEYLEFTVRTPGVANRGKRRIVARRNGILFFTACHYERVPGAMPKQDRIDATLQVDPEWRNGFYVVTGIAPPLRLRIAAAIKAMP